MYLFDTDTISHIVKPGRSEVVLDRMATVPLDQQFTSTITLGEMIYGAYKSSRPQYHIHQLTEHILPHVHVLPFDGSAAEMYGEIRAGLERAGMPLVEADLRIASIALSRGLILVTGNTRHFSRVPRLRVENWM